MAFGRYRMQSGVLPERTLTVEWKAFPECPRPPATGRKEIPLPTENARRGFSGETELELQRAASMWGLFGAPEFVLSVARGSWEVLHIMQSNQTLKYEVCTYRCVCLDDTEGSWVHKDAELASSNPTLRVLGCGTAANNTGLPLPRKQSSVT